MDRLLKEYLETAYESPIDVKLNKTDSCVRIDVYCKKERIAQGYITEGKDWKFITWTIPIDTWNNISNYIPLIEPMLYKDIISWIRNKCKKQGISLPKITGLNLK